MKSPSENVAPWSLSILILTSNSPMFAITLLSVISNISCFTWGVESFRTALNVSTKSRWLNWMGLILIDKIQCWGIFNAGHLFIKAIASFNTHSPIGTMSPVSSAIGINSTGEIIPLVGWFHLINASALTILPLELTLGFKTKELAIENRLA